MARKKSSVGTTTVEIHRLKGKRKGALLKEQIWFEDGEVVAYNLAYINLRRCSGDNGRVLGYDNSHAALVERFIGEVHELWRIEDEEA